MHRHSKPKIFLTALALGLVTWLSVSPGALAADPAAGSSELEQAQKAVETYTAQRGNLEQTSVGSERTLRGLQASIQRQQATVDEATRKAEAITRQLEVLKSQRDKTMRQSYITGTGISYLYALLDSGSLSEFLSKGAYANALANRKDRDVESVDEQMSRLRQVREELVAGKVAAEKQIAELQRSLQQLQKALAENAAKLAEAEAYLLSLTGDATARDCRRFGNDVASGQYTINGGGLGHGVGLSQFGANGSAQHGKDYRQILGHYFQGTSIGGIGNPMVRHGNPQEGYRTESMDSYVAGVVAGEMPGYLSEPEALKAQAVAARSFAYDLIRHGDIPDDTTKTQEYSSNQTGSDTAAAQSTAGQVVTYQGNPVKTFFHSSSGGCTENVENVWVTPQPWHRGVNSPWEDDPHNNYWNWSRTFSTADLESRLGIGGIRSVRVTARGVSGRALNLEVTTANGSVRLTGEEFEASLGLPSTLFGFK